MLYVTEADSYCNAEDHEHPVDLGYVNLTVYLFGGVNNLDPWEATKGLALVDYRECSADDCLTPHNRS